MADWKDEVNKWVDSLKDGRLDLSSFLGMWLYSWWCRSVGRLDGWLVDHLDPHWYIWTTIAWHYRSAKNDSKWWLLLTLIILWHLSNATMRLRFLFEFSFHVFMSRIQWNISTFFTDVHGFYIMSPNNTVSHLNSSIGSLPTTPKTRLLQRASNLNMVKFKHYNYW